MICLSDLPVVGSSNNGEVEHKGLVCPHVEEEHRREIPSRVKRKSMAMARALGREV